MQRVKQTACVHAVMRTSARTSHFLPPFLRVCLRGNAAPIEHSEKRRRIVGRGSMAGQTAPIRGAREPRGLLLERNARRKNRASVREAENKARLSAACSEK